MRKDKTLLKQHKQNLSDTRKLINFLMVRLEKLIDSKEFTEELQMEWKYIWGEKENVVSVLTKLTGLLVKVIPIEQQIVDSENIDVSEKKQKGVLTKNDKEIIRRYVERQKKG